MAMKYQLNGEVFSISLIIILVLFICFTTYQSSFSQTNTSSPFSKSHSKIKGASGDTFDGKYRVNLQYGPEIVRNGESTFFMVNLFENVGDKQVRLRHVDCDFIITKDGTERYRMSTKYGEPFFHSINGVMLPTFKFTEIGKYTISIEIAGILFAPIPTTSANFSVIASATTEDNLEIRFSPGYSESTVIPTK